MSRWLLPFLILLAPGAQAQDSNLRRLTLRQDTLGWEAVGRIDLPGGSFCTGVLVASDRVLTAAHCVIDPYTGGRQSPEDITFQAGYVDGVAIAVRGVKRFVAHPDFDPADRQTIESVQNDVALLELAEPVSAATAAPFAVIGLAQSAREVSVVSYAQGRAEALSWQPSCPILGRRDGLIAFGCDVDYGSSGAPVFDRSGRRARIVSMISAGGRDADGDGAREFALGMELPQLVADLEAMLRAAPLPPPPGPRIRPVTPGGTREGGARFIKP